MSFFVKLIFIALTALMDYFLIYINDITERNALIYSLYLMNIFYGAVYIAAISSKKIFGIENNSGFRKNLIMINHYMVFPIKPTKVILLFFNKINQRIELYLVFFMPVLFHIYYFLAFHFYFFIIFELIYTSSIMLFLFFFSVMYIYFQKYIVIILEIYFVSFIFLGQVINNQNSFLLIVISLTVVGAISILSSTMIIKKMRWNK